MLPWARGERLPRRRLAVAEGIAVGKELRQGYNLATDKEAQKILFGQRARV